MPFEISSILVPHHWQYFNGSGKSNWPHVRVALDGVVEVMIQDLVEHYVSQSRDEKGKKVAIELKDTVSHIF